MKQHIVTNGVVLARTDYGEADRILTIITPDQGKLRLIAKGVRRPKSKMAGGIELFSINDITVLPSSRDLKTLVSSRLNVHFGNIVKDIQRTMLGYELLKQINKTTEDEPEPEYYELAVGMMRGLDDASIRLPLVEIWFTMRLLAANGHGPNLQLDTNQSPLAHDVDYIFDFDSMAFSPQVGGPYSQGHIKLMRLASRADSPVVFSKVNNTDKYELATHTLAKSILRQNL